MSVFIGSTCVYTGTAASLVMRQLSARPSLAGRLWLKTTAGEVISHL